MKLLVLDTKNPYVNLAIEEYIFENAHEETFILWQNEPTVVIGKNQNVYSEIDHAFLKLNDIHVARRITGGGAVYHDLGNVNYSFISPFGDSEINFEKFSAPIVEALRNLGLDAVLGGRNDIIIDSKKVSGNAQHTKGRRVLHHGTLLFSSELDTLDKVLHVDPEKLSSKAIRSTRSRVGNIKDFLSDEVDTNWFIRYLTEFLITKYKAELICPPNECEYVSLAKRNGSVEWIFPERDYLSNYVITKKKRFPFGIIELKLSMKNEIITDCKIFGDFFGCGSVAELEDVVIGGTVEDGISNVLRLPDFNFIFGMSREEFCQFFAE